MNLIKEHLRNTIAEHVQAAGAESSKARQHDRRAEAHAKLAEEARAVLALLDQQPGQSGLSTGLQSVIQDMIAEVDNKLAATGEAEHDKARCEVVHDFLNKPKAK